MTRSKEFVLVTGAGGWIGSSVVRRLRDGGRDVECAGRDTPASLVADLSASAAVVVHAGSAYSNARQDFVDGGLSQVLAVARGAARAENAVVFLSSAKVYGWATESDERSSNRLCDEASVYSGSDNFSAAKHVAEQIITHAASRSVLLRISNVYGVGIPAKYAIGTMLKSARDSGRVTLKCDGSSRRDFVHLDDVVHVIVAATVDLIDRIGQPGSRTFNVASGDLQSLSSIARLFGEALGTEVATLGGRPEFSPALDNRRVMEAGWITEFRHPMDGVRSLLEQWKSQPWELE